MANEERKSSEALARTDPNACHLNSMTVATRLLAKTPTSPVVSLAARTESKKDEFGPAKLRIGTVVASTAVLSPRRRTVPV